MLGAVGRCCTGALQALKPGVQPLKALVGSPAVLSRKSSMLCAFERTNDDLPGACQRRAAAMLTLALRNMPAVQQALKLKCHI